MEIESPSRYETVSQDRKKSGNVVALVFGSSLTGVGVTRSLGRAGVPLFSICESSQLPAKSRWFRPLPEAVKCFPTPDRLPEFLEGLSLARAVLIPCSDDWARAIAALPGSLKDRFPASISPLDVIETMTDKWLFARMLQDLDLPHPQTRLLHSLDEMMAQPDASYESMFLKPINSQEFSRRHGVKAFLIEDKAGAIEIMRETERECASAFPILLQAYIPGPPTNHYFVDGFVDRHGKIASLFARRRLRMFPPLLGNSTLMETVPLDEVRGAIGTIEKMWLELEYRGIFSAEFKRDDRDGLFKILEVNARPWWYIEFAARCGIDVSCMSYRDALGLAVEPVTRYPIGRRCVYLHNDYAAYRNMKSGGGLFQWIRSWRGADKAIFSLDDPGPAIFTAVQTVKRKLAGVRSK